MVGWYTLVDYQAFVINLCVTVLWRVGANLLKIDGVIYEQEAFWYSFNGIRKNIKMCILGS